MLGFLFETESIDQRDINLDHNLNIGEAMGIRLGFLNNGDQKITPQEIMQASQAVVIWLDDIFELQKFYLINIFAFNDIAIITLLPNDDNDVIMQHSKCIMAYTSFVSSIATRALPTHVNTLVGCRFFKFNSDDIIYDCAMYLDYMMATKNQTTVLCSSRTPFRNNEPTFEVMTFNDVLYTIGGDDSYYDDFDNNESDESDESDDKRKTVVLEEK